MGCHTWFYKKIDSPSDKEIKSAVKEKCENEIQFLEQLIHQRDEIDKDLLDAYPEWTSEWAAEVKPHWERIIAFTNGEKIDLTKFPEFFFEDDYPEEDIISELYSSWKPELTRYVSGKGFYENTEFHDVFRKYGYPEDRLFSMEETMKYIEDPKNGCVVKDHESAKEMLQEFWKKYPDGMIQFG
jgi:hypothetical protein